MFQSDRIRSRVSVERMRDGGHGQEGKDSATEQSVMMVTMVRSLFLLLLVMDYILSSHGFRTSSASQFPLLYNFILRRLPILHCSFGKLPFLTTVDHAFQKSRNVSVRLMFSTLLFCFRCFCILCSASFDCFFFSFRFPVPLLYTIIIAINVIFKPREKLQRCVIISCKRCNGALLLSFFSSFSRAPAVPTGTAQSAY